MSLRDEVLEHYMDHDLLVTVDRDPSKWSTGNGLLFTGIFYTMLALRNELRPSDKKLFETAISDCQIEPGLYNRNPGRNDLESYDDYVGVAAASYHLSSKFSNDIVCYGEKHLWSYNNVSPGKFSLRTWHGRFPGLVDYYRAATGENPSWIGRVILTISIRSALKSDVTAKILAYLKLSVLDGFDGLKREFFEQITKDHGSVNNLFSAYFGPSHPFTKYAPTG